MLLIIYVMLLTIYVMLLAIYVMLVAIYVMLLAIYVMLLAIYVTVFDLISGQSAEQFLLAPKKNNFCLYIFLNFDLISGPSTSGHVWPSGLYIVNLYCLHESHLK